MHWLLLGDFLSTWGYSQVLALLNLHLLQQGFELGTIGLANSVSFLTGSLLAIPAGLLSDLYGYRTGLTLSFASLGTAVWLKLYAHSPLLLCIAFGLVGAATALSSAAKTPAIATLTRTSKLPSALALCRALASVGAVGGGLTAAWLSAQSGGHDLALGVGAGIASVAFLPLLALPRDYRRVRILLFSPKRFSKPSAEMPLVPFALFCIASSCVFPFINVALAERGISTSGIGLSFAAFQAVAVLAWPLTHLLGRSLSLGLRISLVGLLIACGWLCFMGPLHIWWLGWLVWHVCIGTGYSFFYARFGGADSNQGSFFALLGLLQMAAAAVGSWCGGMVAQIGAFYTFVLAGALFLLALLLIEVQGSVRRQ